MPTIDERVAFLEGKVEEHSRGFGELRGMVAQLAQKVDRRFEAVDRRFEALEQRLDLKVGALDQKMSRQFVWIVGVQVAILLAVVGALVGS